MLCSASGLLRLPHTVSSKPCCTSINTRAAWSGSISRMGIPRTLVQVASTYRYDNVSIPQHELRLVLHLLVRAGWTRACDDDGGVWEGVEHEVSQKSNSMRKWPGAAVSIS